jgi:cyclopropane fatty-acyl-phospholipid synthase-like methyltransferase
MPGPEPTTHGGRDGKPSSVGAYYDQTQVLYDLFWAPGALHFGFWENETLTLAEAARNTDRLIGLRLGISKADRVLDAGCGTGGTGIYLAENCGATVVGITLSRLQLRRARSRARASPAAARVQFLERDFVASGFPPASFSRVVAVESVVHAPSKAAFLGEAFRLLRPGGRLAVVDAFLRAPGLPEREAGLYRDVLEGWHLGPIPSVQEFGEQLRAAGFVELACEDKTEAIRPSSRRMFYMGQVLYPLISLLVFLRLAPPSVRGCAIAVLRQKRLFDAGWARYCVFLARKPANRPEPGQPAAATPGTA